VLTVEAAVISSYSMESGKGRAKLVTFSDLYTKLSELGRGAFGRVYHCIHLPTSRECAVKAVPKSELSVEMLPEFSIMSELDNANIVKLHAVTETEDLILFEMELLRGGSLKDLLSKRSLRPEEAARVMLGILRGVSYLHGKNVVHRDLKPENILFKEQGNLDSVKIGDFGLSTQLDSDNYYNCLNSNAGTVIFMAPEQGQHKYYSRPVDMWSCGLILFMMISGSHPFYREGDNAESYFNRLNTATIEFPKTFPSLAVSLCRHLTKTIPLERYSAVQALSHPFITRTQGDIPMTAMDRMRQFNDEQKLARILLALMFVANQPKAARRTLVMPASRLNITDPRVLLKASKHSKRLSIQLKPASLGGKQSLRLNSLGRASALSNYSPIGERK
jgi:calcium/calmodulin-dependent protein kinase I